MSDKLIREGNVIRFMPGKYHFKRTCKMRKNETPSEAMERHWREGNIEYTPLDMGK